MANQQPSGDIIEGITKDLSLIKEALAGLFDEKVKPSDNQSGGSHDRPYKGWNETEEDDSKKSNQNNQSDDDDSQDGDSNSQNNSSSSNKSSKQSSKDEKSEQGEDSEDLQNSQDGESDDSDNDSESGQQSGSGSNSGSKSGQQSDSNSNSSSQSGSDSDESGSSQGQQGSQNDLDGDESDFDDDESDFEDDSQDLPFGQGGQQSGRNNQQSGRGDFDDDESGFGDDDSLPKNIGSIPSSGQQSGKSGQDAGQQSGQDGEQSEQNGQQSGQDGQQSSQQGDQQSGQQSNQQSGQQSGQQNGQQSSQQSGQSSTQNGSQSNTHGNQSEQGDSQNSQNNRGSSQCPAMKDYSNTGDPSEALTNAMMDVNSSTYGMRKNMPAAVQKGTHAADSLKSIAQSCAQQGLMSQSTANDLSALCDEVKQNVGTPAVSASVSKLISQTIKARQEVDDNKVKNPQSNNAGQGDSSDSNKQSGQGSKEGQEQSEEESKQGSSQSGESGSGQSERGQGSKGQGDSSEDFDDDDDGYDDIDDEELQGDSEAPASQSDGEKGKASVDEVNGESGKGCGEGNLRGGVLNSTGAKSMIDRLREKDFSDGDAGNNTQSSNEPIQAPSRAWEDMQLEHASDDEIKETSIIFNGRKIRIPKMHIDLISTTQDANELRSMNERARERMQSAERQYKRDNPNWDKESGSISEGAVRQVEVAISNALNWKRILAQFLKAMPARSVTYSKPNVATVGSRAAIPAIRRYTEPTGVEDIKICIDTSGSFDNMHIAWILGECANIFNQFVKPKSAVRGQLIYWSDSVDAVGEFKNISSMMKIEPKTTGGTNVIPLLHFLAGESVNGFKLKKNKPSDTSFIMIVTDGYFSLENDGYCPDYFIKMQPSKKLHWLIVGSNSDVDSFRDKCHFGKIMKFNPIG